MKEARKRGRPGLGRNILFIGLEHLNERLQSGSRNVDLPALSTSVLVNWKTRYSYARAISDFRSFDPGFDQRASGSAENTRSARSSSGSSRAAATRLSVLDGVSAPDMTPEIWESVDEKTTTIITDALGAYEGIGRGVSGGRKTIQHSDGE